MKLAREPEVLVLLEEEVVVRTRRFRRENPEMFDFCRGNADVEPAVALLQCGLGRLAVELQPAVGVGGPAAGRADPGDAEAALVADGVPGSSCAASSPGTWGSSGEFGACEVNSAVRELLKNDPKGLAQTVRKYLKRAERVQAVAESLSRCAMEDGGYER